MASFSAKHSWQCIAPLFVRLGIANDGPFFDRNVTLIFESPNKSRELCLVSLGQSFKVLLMVVVTSFKIRLTTAIIRHRFAVWCTYGYLEITHLIRHFPSSRQSRLLRQLQGGVSVSADESRLSTCLLC